MDERGLAPLSTIAIWLGMIEMTGPGAGLHNLGLWTKTLCLKATDLLRLVRAFRGARFGIATPLADRIMHVVCDFEKLDVGELRLRIGECLLDVTPVSHPAITRVLG